MDQPTPESAQSARADGGLAVIDTESSSVRGDGARQRMAVLEQWFERICDSSRASRVEDAPPWAHEELRALLAARDEGERQLEAPRWVVAPADVDSLSGAPTSLPPGSRVGRFTVIHELGRGGMGVVFLARQDQPQRDVALKVLAAPLPTAEAVARFMREAEALARLRHEGIAAVYDAGVFAGPFGESPYIAMEMVEGGTLAEVIASTPDGVAGIPSERLRRLHLLAKVCDAVAHAHQCGVLHRDLKPGNVLVDRAGMPRVLDFGVARLIDDSGRMATGAGLNSLRGDLAGTLAYMSPEQLLRGEGDTRSDVYALGLMCIEVMCGSAALGSRPSSIEAAIRCAQTGRASPAMPGGDLGAVLSKAIAAEPDDRYSSARELAEDLRCLAGGLPVRARPATLTYVLSRWIRRHPGRAGALAMAALAALSLVATTVVTGVIAQREGRRATEASQLAQERLTQQRKFVTQTLVRTSSTLLSIPGGYKLQEPLLNDAITSLEGLAESGRDDPGLLADLSRAVARLAHALGGLGTPNSGNPVRARELMTRSLTMAQRAVELNPESDETLAALEDAHWGLASLPGEPADRTAHRRLCADVARQRYDRSGPNFSPFLKSNLAYRLMAASTTVQEAKAAESHYAELVAMAPANWEYRCAHGTACKVLAEMIESGLGLEPVATAEARAQNGAIAAEAERAHALLRECLRERPENYSCARHLADTILLLARTCVRAGDRAAAAAHGESCLNLIEKYPIDMHNTLHVRDRFRLAVLLTRTLDGGERWREQRNGELSTEEKGLMSVATRAVALLPEDALLAVAGFTVEERGIPEQLKAALAQWSAAKESSGAPRRNPDLPR